MGQKHEQTLPKNCSKSTKMAIRLQYADLQIFSGGAGPLTPLKSFLLLKLLKINSAGNKLRLKKMTTLVPPP